MWPVNSWQGKYLTPYKSWMHHRKISIACR